MTDENNHKKKKVRKEEKLDDIFEDVLGKRKEVTTETEVKIKESIKRSSHSILDPRPASSVSMKAEQDDIWLCNQYGQIFSINMISPEDFAWWVNDKLPGTRKITKEQVTTLQQRKDIFEEVIAILEHWFKITQSTVINHNIF